MKYFNLKFIFSFLFIVVFIPISVLCEEYNKYKIYPKYLENNTKLVPIIRGQDYSVFSRKYDVDVYSTDVVILDNDHYTINNGIYYYINHFGEESKPNYARAKSVEQTIKQRCKQEKRKPNSIEKKILKYIIDSKQDIEEADFLYNKDKQERERITQEIERKNKIILYLISVIISVIILIYIIYIYIVAKKNKESQRKKFLIKNFFSLYEKKEYSNAIETLQRAFIEVSPRILLEKHKSMDLHTFDMVAYCYLEINKYEKAILFYNYILNSNKKNKKAFYNRAIAKYKLNSNDTKDLEYIYNHEKPFMTLKKQMHLQFNDEEQKTAKQTFENNKKINKIGNVFGAYNIIYI